MSYSSSEPEARDLGFTLPKGTDLIRNGDDAITTNALVATGALRAAFNRLRTLEDAPPPIADHGDLTGRGDDDHPQYLNNSRGDARYAPLSHVHTLGNVTGLSAALDGKADAEHSHGWADVTGKPSNFPPSAHVHTAAEVGAVPADDPRLRDTGWRDITTALTASWGKSSVLGRVLMRRVGDRVEYDARLVPTGVVGNGRQAATSVLSVPGGWRPRNDHLIAGAWFVYSSGPQGLVRVSGGSIQTQAAAGTPGTWGASDLVVMHGEWTTADPWPTTLPGIPG